MGVNIPADEKKETADQLDKSRNHLDGLISSVERSVESVHKISQRTSEVLAGTIGGGVPIVVGLILLHIKLDLQLGVGTVVVGAIGMSASILAWRGPKSWQLERLHKSTFKTLELLRHEIEHYERASNIEITKELQIEYIQTLEDFGRYRKEIDSYKSQQFLPFIRSNANSNRKFRRPSKAKRRNRL